MNAAKGLEPASPDLTAAFQAAPEQLERKVRMVGLKNRRGRSLSFGLPDSGSVNGYLIGSLMSLNIASISSLERSATALSTTSRVRCGAKR